MRDPHRDWYPCPTCDYVTPAFELATRGVCTPCNIRAQRHKP